MSVQLRDPHHKSGGRVITMTSTISDEGKTTNATWLATTAAQSGEKVLIIDGDMRRPSLHKSFNIGNAKGLVDYLSDRLPLDEAIYKKTWIWRTYHDIKGRSNACVNVIKQ